ncbi:hypothetical protein WNZ15_24860 [Roseibium sp. AS2]|uniref:hypothetical protein n=1 Tax=Roseibium sp. AS2 TaxID=3135781 RepID=UPI00317D0426
MTYLLEGGGIHPGNRALNWAFAIALFIAAMPAPAASETREERRSRNCAYYREMVERALENIDTDALSSGFSHAHDGFVAGGCLVTGAACPKTPADFAFADLLTIMTVSANMGSTFTPFRCPVTERERRH